MNAADDDKRADAVEAMADEGYAEDDSFVRVLMHSLAFGSLLPVIAETPKETPEPEARWR